jgi:hypothetical protein
LAQETVAVLVGRALPWAARVAEIHLDTGVEREANVLAHLLAAIPGQRTAQVLRQFENAQLPVLAGPVLEGLDGILGMDGFAGKKISADFVRDRFTISQSLGRPAGLSYSVVPVKFLSQRLLMVDAYVGRVRTKAIIDTGGLRTLGNPALLAALNHGHSDRSYGLETRVVDATEALQLGRTGRVPLIRLGEAHIDHLDVTFGDFHVFESWAWMISRRC